MFKQTWLQYENMEFIRYILDIVLTMNINEVNRSLWDQVEVETYSSKSWIRYILVWM